MVVLDTRTARMFTNTIQEFQRDIHREWHRDYYECWKVDRPTGWEDSTSIEVQNLVCAGWGRLYLNGVGGPQGGDLVIHVESPYRFRLQAGDPVETGNLLVISNRLFRVDTVKLGHVDSVLMDAYLTELFLTPAPEMV